MTEPKSAKTRYKTTNWAAYNAALKARRSLTIWLDKDMQWYAPASGKRERQRIFSEAAIQFCLSIKCLFNLALRQSLGLVESLLRLAGLDWSVPDNSAVCRRQKTLLVQLPYRASTTALDLLVDSTGIKFLGEGEWKRKKHGAEYRRQWRKVHLGIDAHTLEIRAIEVTDNSVENGKPWKATLMGASMRNEALKSCHRLGYALWKQWSGYHRKSLGTTKMHCFKRLGERVMAHTFERQVVELHVRVALLNRFTQLGCPTTVPVAAMAWLRLGLGPSRFAFDLCNKASETPPDAMRVIALNGLR